MEENSVNEAAENVVNESAEQVDTQNENLEATNVEVQEEVQQAQTELPEGAKEEDPYGVKKRFAKFAQQRDQMQMELEQQKEAYRQLQEQVAKMTAEPPKTRDDFIDDADYIAYVADQKAQEKFNQYQKEQQAQIQKQQQMQQSTQNWMNKVETYKEELPDFAEVVGGATDILIPPTALEVIQESDVGPKMVYYLAQNKEEASKLTNMSDRQLDRYMMKLELKMESTPLAQPKEPKQPAPAMPKPNGTIAQGQPESIDRWMEKRRQQVRGG